MADLSLILQDESVKARFWSGVDQLGPDECWPWVRSCNHRGYGRFGAGGRYFGAHRFSLMLAVGRLLLADEMACHHCDNPRCCNPSHLYVGNAYTNLEDMRTRNRFARWNGARRGSANPKAKLTEADVAFMREKHGELSYRQLANMFGLTRDSVKQIVYRRYWRHV